MPDTVSKEARSQIMARVRSCNTSPELAVRRTLHAAGFRFRLHRKDLPGNPDLVLPRYRTAVYVNGCFWHWHGCRRSRMPATNRDYWEKKIARNVERDGLNQARLKAIGWSARTIWECELASGTDALIRDLQERRPTVAAC